MQLLQRLLAVLCFLSVCFASNLSVGDSVTFSSFKKEDFLIKGRTTHTKGEDLSYETLFVQHKQFDQSMSEVKSVEVCRGKDSVAILLYDHGVQKIVLVEQARIGAAEGAHSPWLLELPAGGIDEGELSAESAARREAEEETGSHIDEIELIMGYYLAPGVLSEHVSLFFAQVDLANEGVGSFGLGSEGEDIKRHVVTVDEAFELLRSGEIRDASTLIALQWFMLNKDVIDRKWHKDYADT